MRKKMRITLHGITLDSFRTDITSIILPFALPIIAEQGFIMLMGLVNAGMASAAGTAVASAVGLVNAITNIAISLFSALALGGTVAVARSVGALDHGSARKASGQTITLCLSISFVVGAVISLGSEPIVAALFGSSPPAVRENARTYLGITAMGYPFLAATLAAAGILRGAGNVRAPMFVNIAMNLVNMILGRLLILGLAFQGHSIIPPMGAVGAALAITGSRAAGTLFYINVLLRSASASRPSSISEFRLSRGVLKDILSVGIPASVESLLFNGGKLITQTFLAGLGEVAMTADYLSSMVAGTIQVPGVGFSMAVTPLVGRTLGQGDREGARRIVLSSLIAGMLFLALTSMPGFFLAEFFIGISTSDARVARTASLLIRFFLIVNPLAWSSSFLVPAGLRGAGDGKFTMWVSILSMWCFRVGLGWLLSHPAGWGVSGIWVAMVLDWFVRSLFFIPRLLSPAFAIHGPGQGGGHSATHSPGTEARETSKTRGQ